MAAFRLIRRLRDLLDVNPAGLAVGDVPTWDGTEFTMDAPSGVPAGPAGGVLDGTYPNPGLAASVAGVGLAETANVLSVNVDALTVEIVGDTLQVKDGGITIAKLSFDPATQVELNAVAANLAAHLADLVDAHDASAISVTPFDTIAATDVQAALEEILAEAAGAGAPTTADYLVGTADGGLSNEIVVGTSPGGELGGTWASPTVDAVHSGSSHAATQAAAEATAAAALNAHISDATDAHDASAISIVDAAGDFTATEVEGALAELQAADEADEAALAAHLADAADAHDASAISVVPFSSIVATDVQAALEEVMAEAGGGGGPPTGAAGGVLSGTYPNPGFAADMATQAELDAHITDATDAHDASAVSSVPAGTLAATDVQSALDELDTEKLAAATFSDHSARHENGGADEITVAGLSGLLADGQTPLAHAASHQDGGSDEISISGLSGVSAELALHLADGTDAHDASAISIVDAANDFTATEVEGALAELQAADETDEAALAAHLADTTDAHDASAISSVAAGTLSATDVQAALNELDSEKAATASAVMDGDAAGGVLSGTYPNPGFAADMATQAELDAHVNDTTDAHDASAISILDAANDFTATDVEGALAELQTADEADEAALAAHLADTVDAHDASAISVVPTGTIAATDVQAALAELAAEAVADLLRLAVTQVAHGLAVGNVVRMSGTSYVKAQANSEANAEAVGIVSAVADADNFTVQTGGRITGLSGLTAGAVYYLDDDTAGLLTATEPPDVGDISKPLLIANTTTSGWIFNMRGKINAASTARNLLLYESVVLK